VQLSTFFYRLLLEVLVYICLSMAAEMRSSPSIQGASYGKLKAAPNEC